MDPIFPTPIETPWKISRWLTQKGKKWFLVENSEIIFFNISLVLEGNAFLQTKKREFDGFAKDLK